MIAGPQKSMDGLRFGAVLLALAAGGILVGSCTNTASAPIAAKPEPVVIPVPVETAPVASAMPVATAQAARPVSDARVFACGGGARTCRVGQETCCAFQEEGVCVASVPDDAPRGNIGYLASQWAVCDKITFPSSSSFDHMDRCDESADCTSSEICCEQFLFSGGTLNECTAPNANGDSPCNYRERCLEGSPCRLAGTECIEGACVKPVLNPRCGDAVCGEGTVCCGEPVAACKPMAECSRYSRIACARDADCVKGQRCLSDGRSTVCLGFPPDSYNPSYVCGRDADCPSVCGSAHKGKMRCSEGLIPWLKSCQCP